MMPGEVYVSWKKAVQVAVVAAGLAAGACGHSSAPSSQRAGDDFATCVRERQGVPATHGTTPVPPDPTLLAVLRKCNEEHPVPTPRQPPLPQLKDFAAYRSCLREQGLVLPAADDKAIPPVPDELMKQASAACRDKLPATAAAG
jgi:hypothetical protein